MHVAALDLSLTAPARCMPDGTTEVLDTSSMRGFDRWSAIRGFALDAADSCDVLAIEGYAYAARGRSIISLGELGGIVRYTLHAHEVPFIEVTPGSIKKYATGKGNAGKEAVLVAAVRRGGDLFAGTTNDEADAFMLWALVKDALGEAVVEMPARHREACEVVEDALADLLAVNA